VGETREIRICGFGGQGIILAGTILGHAAVLDAKWVAESASYGSAARGGNCKTDLVISEESAIYPYVTTADILIAMSQKAYDIYIKDVKEDGLVIYDNGIVKPDQKSTLKHIIVPATELAMKELGNRQVANIVMLGAVVEITGIISKDSVIAAIKGNVAERFLDINCKAVDVGLKLGQGVKPGSGKKGMPA